MKAASKPKETLHPKPELTTSTAGLMWSVQNKSKIGSTATIKDRLLNKLSSISADVMSISEDDELVMIEKHINSCLSAMKVFKSGLTSEPANKKTIRQRNFYSTKRRREMARVRLAKPSLQQKSKTINRLLSATDNIILPRNCIGESITNYHLFC